MISQACVLCLKLLLKAAKNILVIFDSSSRLIFSRTVNKAVVEAPIVKSAVNRKTREYSDKHSQPLFQSRQIQGF